jgi:hypothetical protein
MQVLETIGKQIVPTLRDSCKANIPLIAPLITAGIVGALFRYCVYKRKSDTYKEMDKEKAMKFGFCAGLATTAFVIKYLYSINSERKENTVMILISGIAAAILVGFKFDNTALITGLVLNGAVLGHCDKRTRMMVYGFEGLVCGTMGALYGTELIG